MNHDERMKLIETRLKKAFAPSILNIINESKLHAGHAGSRSGAGHYAIEITSECFKNQSRVEAHRAIYQLLNDLIPDEIHALKIKIIP